MPSNNSGAPAISRRFFSAARYALVMAYRQTRDIEQATRQLAIYQRNPSGLPLEDALMAQITALNEGGLIRAQAAQQYLAQGRPGEAAKQLEDGSGQRSERRNGPQ